MADRFYRVDVQKDYAKAGPTDFVELLPAAEGHGLCVRKCTVEILFDAITGGEMMHVTGPTGSGKTSLIEALCSPRNFAALCAIPGLIQSGFQIAAVVLENADDLSTSERVDAIGDCVQESGAMIQAIEEGLEEVIQLLETPPGRRPGYPAKIAK